MNYLAHAYLSFNNPEILLGNMISDFVKGKKKFDYPDNIQKGIALHRAIDNFTDNHEETKKASQFFKPDYGLYAGAFVDIVYDHFLAKDHTEFPNGLLADFSKTTYAQLRIYNEFFPEKFHRLFHYMQLHDWLYNYQFNEMIAQSFRGLVLRAAYMSDSTKAFQVFETHYGALEKCYSRFFPLLKEYAYTKYKELQF